MLIVFLRDDERHSDDDFRATDGALVDDHIRKQYSRSYLLALPPVAAEHGRGAAGAGHGGRRMMGRASR